VNVVLINDTFHILHCRRLADQLWLLNAYDNNNISCIDLEIQHLYPDLLSLFPCADTLKLVQFRLDQDFVIC